MIVDLTHALFNGMTHFPGTREPRFDILNSLEVNGFAEIIISMTTHTGTHMDAPAHQLANTKTLDQIPLEDLMGIGYVFNCKELTEISVDFLKQHKEKIAHSQYLLFYSGWDQKWNTPHYFDPFPVLTEAAAEWLIRFPIIGVGFDSISADPMDSKDLPIHHILLRKGIVIVENLCNLDQLLDKSFTFYTIPLKIKDSDGSPVRAFAKILN